MNQLRKSRVNRVNKGNRPTIVAYICDRFDDISRRKKGRVTLIDIWETQFVIQNVFNISDWQSQILTWEQINQPKIRE